MINLPGFLRKVPTDTNRPAAELLAAAERLALLLTQENLALAAHDVTRATGLVGDKARALAAFELACLNMHGHLIADELQRSTAETLSTRLQALAQENRRLLERALFIQKRVLALFARAVARAAPTQYGAQQGAAMRQLNALALSAKA